MLALPIVDMLVKGVGLVAPAHVNLAPMDVQVVVRRSVKKVAVVNVVVSAAADVKMVAVGRQIIQVGSDW